MRWMGGGGRRGQASEFYYCTKAEKQIQKQPLTGRGGASIGDQCVS